MSELPSNNAKGKRSIRVLLSILFLSVRFPVLQALTTLSLDKGLVSLASGRTTTAVRFLDKRATRQEMRE